VLAALPGGLAATRATFESILFGPVDWTARAAISALGELARRDPESARDAVRLLCDVVED
jgi:hypothetical protein